MRGVKMGFGNSSSRVADIKRTRVKQGEARLAGYVEGSTEAIALLREVVGPAIADDRYDAGSPDDIGEVIRTLRAQRYQLTRVLSGVMGDIDVHDGEYGHAVTSYERDALDALGMAHERVELGSCARCGMPAVHNPERGMWHPISQFDDDGPDRCCTHGPIPVQHFIGWADRPREEGDPNPLARLTVMKP